MATTVPGIDRHASCEPLVVARGQVSFLGVRPDAKTRDLTPSPKETSMRGPLRGLLAGAAAWKLGGGCLSTIVIFVLAFWLLGHVEC
jgi:hypothetical protein